MPTRKSPAVSETPTTAAAMPAAVPTKNPLPAEKSTPKLPAKPPAKPAQVPPRKAVKSVKTVKKAKVPAAPAAPAAKSLRANEKLVRDSFTMPRADFGLIQQLKDRALGFQRATKKSELLRAGLQALADLGDAQLQTRLGKLATIKAGRPKKTD